MVAFSIGCHPGLAGSWVCVHKVHTKSRGSCGTVGRRRTSASSVNCTDREQLPQQQPAPLPLEGPCSLFVPAAAKKVHCVELRSWLDATDRLQGRARSPLLVTACLCVGKGRIGGWMREIRACSWRYSRFGQQDKRWSLHTAITIPYSVFCLRCNAAMLHSLNFGTATSDWSASGSSLVKGGTHGMAWHGISYTVSISCRGSE